MAAIFTCHACETRLTDTTKPELRKQGWTWYEVGYARRFVMCGACVEAYAKRREEKAKAAA